MTVAARRRWLLVAAAAVVIVLAVRVTLLRDSGEPSVEEFCEEFAHLLVVDELSLTVNPNDDASARDAMDRTARQFADARSSRSSGDSPGRAAAGRPDRPHFEMLWLTQPHGRPLTAPLR